jgi:hypothetical protein
MNLNQSFTLLIVFFLLGISPSNARGICLMLYRRDELLITSAWNTDSFGFSKKDGTYSKLFEDIGFLMLNALTRLNTLRRSSCRVLCWSVAAFSSALERRGTHAHPPTYFEGVKNLERDHGPTPAGAFLYALRTDWSKGCPDVTRMENKDANLGTIAAWRNWCE